MRTREQWLALAVLLGCLVFLDVAPPEFAFDSAAVPVQAPSPRSSSASPAPDDAGPRSPSGATVGQLEAIRS